MDPPPSKSWSIHTRREVIAKYQILERVGSGAYSDVYKARRLSDSVTVALKEVHDYQSAFSEIEALQTLQHSSNVVVLHEYFWSEDEDAVLVLEFLQADLASVIREAKKNGGLSVGEIKRWIVQILCGVDACHRSSIIHRDLKPSNLLISAEGVLKLADFGQARILLETGDVSADDNTQPHMEEIPNEATMVEPPKPEEARQEAEGILSQGVLHEKDRERQLARILLETGDVSADDNTQPHMEEIPNEATMVEPPKPEEARQEAEGILSQGVLHEKDRERQLENIRAKDPMEEIDYEISIHDANTSCVATCTNSDLEDDIPKSSYSYEAEEGGTHNYGQLTSCVGTRWFRAPELLYGSTNYGSEIDLWSLGCIFAELFILEPIFPGSSDIDQLSRIFSTLGNLTEEVWPSCSKLPDYQMISFGKVENPSGIEAHLANRSLDEILFVKKLLCFDPASRATAMELLHDKYLNEEPLPVPISQLRVPASNSGQDEDSSGEWVNYRDTGSDSDFDDFDFTKTDTGFSLKFL